MMNNYSVLMSVYHKEKADYLRDAMDSIWNQTIPTDDFVLVCDGPLNEELEEVINYMLKDHLSVLKIIRLENNLGLGNALNEGLKHCKNELVARMDSDDIADYQRCEKQLQVFQNNTDIDLCSGTILEFDGSIDKIIGMRKLPESNEDIRSFSKKRNPFNHPAVMFKKSSVESAGGYDEKFHLFEDYYLWIRMFLNGSSGKNIIEPILYMRTPADFYLRRGGFKYSKAILSFYKWMKSENWITAKEYFFSAFPHAFLSIMPNFLRKMVYLKIHN